jgi:hypothetical protein
MNKFMEWLTDEAKGVLSVIGYAAFAALIVISLDYTVENALINWKILPPPALPREGESPFKYYNALMFAGLFVWAPLKEEIFHRVVPLAFLTAFMSKSLRTVFGLNILFAVIFGAIHPYGLDGKILTGVGGFFFGLVFLKCGGLNRSYFKASAAAMLAHSFTNVFVVLDMWWRYFELK